MPPELLVTWVGCVLVSVVTGCGPGHVETLGTPSKEVDASRVKAILDPQVAAYGFEPLWNSFDGGGGTPFAGEGWAPPEENASGSFAWVTGTEASLWLARPSAGGDLEFRALCRALPFNGAPAQEMTLLIDGEVAGSATIGGCWQEIAISIPDGAFGPALNRVKLEFAWSRKPADVGLSQDRRDLSAAFRWVAIGAAGSFGRHETSRRTATFDSNVGVLRLDPGAGVEIPVPVRSHFEALLEGTSAIQGSADIEIIFETPVGERLELWRGLVDSRWSYDLRVDNPDRGIGYLRIRNVFDEGQGAAGGEAAVMDWRPANFRIRPIREAPPQARPHVFLYVVDTVRVDSLALFGGTRPTSPELEDFARDAVVFKHAVVASTWTLPSVVSMLTGVYPFRHGIMKGDVKLSLASPHPTLASILGGSGYDTVGISQSYVAGPKFGIDTGFSRFFFNNQLNGRRLRTADVRRIFTEWLSREHNWERPVFGYIHTVGPHAPYRPTGEFRRFADAIPGDLPELEYRPSRFVSEGYGHLPAEVDHLRALYDGEVEYADAEFGRFVDALKYFGLYDDSIVVFVSDHGEEFAEHGGFDHGRTVFEEVAKVPLVVKYPSGYGIGGSVVTNRVSTVDIFASIVETAGAAVGESIIDGRALPTVGTGSDEIEKENRPIFSELNVVANEIYQPVNYRALWMGSTKCIENLTGRDRFGEPEPQLQVFDLVADQGENALLPGEDPRYDACRVWLAGWARIIEDGSLEDGAGPRSSEETLEMLRALGYIN